VYLGFFVSVEGLKMDTENLKAIIEWPTPRSAMDVRSLHGLEIFYRNFIKGFSSICAPLIETIRGDRREFKWTIGAEIFFDMLKKKVTKKIISEFIDFNKLFQVDCDTSGNAIGDVLSQ
jgi:hypothetical protein